MPPQELSSDAQAGRLPWGAPATGVHVPTAPARLQASHCPPQAVSQQTPSTQLPLAHWFAAEQLPPGDSCGTQVPELHQLPAAHWASVEQVALQAVAAQAKEPQDWVEAGGQDPAPSQAAASVAVPAVQEAARHCDAALG